MKIGLIGEFYSKNLGEPLLFACTKYMWNKFSDDRCEFRDIDIFGRSSVKDPIFSNDNLPVVVMGMKICRKIKRKLLTKDTLFLDEKIWEYGNDRKRLHRYFIKNMRGLDAIVIMGAGTIKYDVRLNFAPFYKELIECAEYYNIPVFLNCAGIESKCNPKDRRSRMFSEVLSKDILKIATTRDDLKTLNCFIKNSKTETGKIADIAVWSAETFHKNKKESDIIGLGIITPERFVEFKRKITPDQYEKEWLKIIQALENDGKKWMIFNNGDDCDREYAEILCKKAGYSISEKLVTPKNPKELVEIISNFEGIITSRLHSCIVAYSLDIPFVCIAWNNKLKYFTSNIGYPERMIDADEFDVQTVLCKYQKAIVEQYDEKARKEYRETIIEYIKKYIQVTKECKVEREG